MNILQAQNLNYTINKTKILKDIKFSVNEGDFVAILGPNGSGKTTLLKNILKINVQMGRQSRLPLQTINLFGTDINQYKRKELAKKIAYVPQIITFDYDFTVETVVLMGRTSYLKVFEDYSEKDMQIAKIAMEKTNVYHLKDRSIHTLSGGELQRVVIARALTQKTPILILDEPVSNLDIYQQIEIMQLLEELNKTENITIVTVLHDINLALKHCNKAILLNKGEVVAQGLMDEVVTVENIKEVFEVDIKLIDTNKHKHMIM